jgi:4-oxalocrotonate tautomerase family enzyme
MPIINIKFIENVVATPEQKAELIVKMTETFSGVLGDVVRPFTYVVIEETKVNDWGIAGKPMPDLAWLCGPEYQGYHAKAREIMEGVIASMAAPAAGASNGAGTKGANGSAPGAAAAEGEVTQELVGQAYAALGTMDPAQVNKYWDEGVHWLVPGHNQLSGWYNGRDQFVGFMKKVGELSGGSFRMEPIAVMTGKDYSADVTHNIGNRAEDPKKILDINVVHVLHWRNGKVVEGRGAIFGDGTEKYDEFWSPVTAAGTRLKG